MSLRRSTLSEGLERAEDPRVLKSRTMTELVAEYGEAPCTLALKVRQLQMLDRIDRTLTGVWAGLLCLSLCGIWLMCSLQHISRALTSLVAAQQQLEQPAGRVEGHKRPELPVQAQATGHLAWPRRVWVAADNPVRFPLPDGLVPQPGFDAFPHAAPPTPESRSVAQAVQP